MGARCRAQGQTGQEVASYRQLRRPRACEKNLLPALGGPRCSSGRKARTPNIEVQGLAFCQLNYPRKWRQMPPEGGRRGSNPRPPGPQPGALPTELRPPCVLRAPGRVRTGALPLRKRLPFRWATGAETGQVPAAGLEPATLGLKDPNSAIELGRHGALGRGRTGDLPLTRRLLYQLSYKGTTKIVRTGRWQVRPLKRTRTWSDLAMVERSRARRGFDETFAQALLGRSDVAVLVVGQDLGVEWLSPAAQRLLGGASA